MQYLAVKIGDAKTQQKKYVQERAANTREEARKNVGRPLGVDYDDQTVVVRASVGKAGIVAKVVADLRAPGAAATWTMQLDAGRHAIAGFNRIESITSNMARMHIHVFDPNIGEYVGEFGAAQSIFDDILSKFPMYASISEMSRSTARQI